MLATLTRPARQLVDSFRPAAMPPMSRANYRWELISAMFFPFALLCVEQGVAGVIAQKAFGASGLVIATITAAKPMANITSILWTRALHGRDRVRFVTMTQLAMVGCVFGAAAAPISPRGTLIFLAFVLLARVCLAGLVTARSDIWRANYPRDARARATGKFTMIFSIIIGAGSLLVGLGMDRAGDFAATAYRIFFFAAGAAALIGVWAFSRVRWRGRRQALSTERLAREGVEEDPASARGMLGILRNDRMYRQFMTAQFMMGIGNLAALAPFIVALDEHMGLGYGMSIALTQAIPFLIPTLTIALWARLLDRTHIVRFRVFHSWVFVAAHLLTTIALLMHNIPLLIISRIILGVGFGGGALAWNLGHHDFAPARMAAAYMGIHVTLTGVRGIMSPFLGILIYGGWRLGVADGALDFRGLGEWAFAAFAAIGAVGALMFLRLDFRLRAQPQPARE